MSRRYFPTACGETTRPDSRFLHGKPEVVVPQSPSPRHSAKGWRVAAKSPEICGYRASGRLSVGAAHEVFGTELPGQDSNLDKENQNPFRVVQGSSEYLIFSGKSQSVIPR